MKFLRSMGPGLIVTAAFIGPGTVVTASQAGASFGFTLLWAVLFSVLATIVLQEMAARLGLVTRHGLGEGIRTTFHNSLLKYSVCFLVVLAIGFGNAAYQTGNLTGASQGLEALSGWSRFVWVPLLGVITFGLLYSGTYKIIEKVLIALVLMMSVVFLLTAIVVSPPLGELVSGLLVPQLPSPTDKSLETALALVGTTVVPYNLFLHANSVQQKWQESTPLDEALRESRWDTGLSISLGGILTSAIVVTAAMTFYGKESFSSVLQVADQLEPILGGGLGRIAFALGLFSAGLTSAITAPLAGAYAVTGALGKESDPKSWLFRSVWMTILGVGVCFALVFGKSPAQTIIIAQLANGFLMPIIAIFLLLVVNRAGIMGQYRNHLFSNIVAALVVLITGALGIWKIYQQLQSIAFSN